MKTPRRVIPFPVANELAGLQRKARVDVALRRIDRQPNFVGESL